MSKKKNIKAAKNTARQTGVAKKPVREKKLPVWGWIFPVVLITAIALYPMLNNEFTNWDDEFYVLNNKLLRGPDWKGIFSQGVVGNYHPLTVLSLAFNYAVSGTEPFSYLLINYIFHLANTILVFYFILKISSNKIAVAAFTALLFGIHPLHVESVAWVSERKDVLYTFFFLLSLLQYWKFLQTGKQLNRWICFLFFILSLLSKPAAIILPVVLLLLDYWKGRPLSRKLVLEKIPFFILSVLFGIITINIQSESAIVGTDTYPLWLRPLFACYVSMIYFIRFIIPYPLSAYYPYPPASDPGLPVLLSPLFILALIFLLWYKRKDKLIVFGFLFFISNLLLVMQIISIGQTIVSERYTYVPYIGLAFMAAMLVDRYFKKANSKIIIGAGAVLVTAIFSFITFQRTLIWKNSGTLWTDVINQFPAAPYPRTNRANYVSIQASQQKDKTAADSLNKLALEDCNIALAINPKLAAGYEKRALIYIGFDSLSKALADADSLVKYDPDNKIGYDVRGTVYFRFNQPQKAMANYDTCILLNPDDHRSYSNRGTIYMNFYQKYPEALVELNKAISINPLGSYLLNRSICYYRIGDRIRAKEDAIAAQAKGTAVPDNFKTLLGIN